MGFRYLSVAVLVICLMMAIVAAHTGSKSKGSSSKEAICEPGCSNGGSCVAPNTCQCAAGYKGSQCKIAICDPVCSNGGSCVAPNTCQCVAGYKGSQCKTAICDPECSNGGSCVAPNTCQCAAGYKGSQCKTAICDPECSNGGSCVAPNSCQCVAGYKGSQCKIAICDPECSNGGSCVAPNTCQCAAGYKGSQCETETVSSFTVCGDSVVQQEGQITTPNYPSNYPDNQRCYTTITAGTGQVVKLTFLDFVTEFSSECTYDYLRLYDGDSVHNTRLGLFCGGTLPGEIVSTGQSLYLEFKSDMNGNLKGFKADINFIQAPAICDPPCLHYGVCNDPNSCDCAATQYEGSRCETAKCNPPCASHGYCSSPNMCDYSG